MATAAARAGTGLASHGNTYSMTRPAHARIACGAVKVKLKATGIMATNRRAAVLGLGCSLKEFSPQGWDVTIGVNDIWRFFSDSDHQWRWERLKIDGTVLQHSKCAYPEYEACVANASQSGYVYLPSSSTRPESPLLKRKRSYMVVPSAGRKRISKSEAGKDPEVETSSEDEAAGVSTPTV